MIEHYNIKFSPAVSQKGIEKAMHEASPAEVAALNGKTKAKIELVGDLADVKQVMDLLKRLSPPTE